MDTTDIQAKIENATREFEKGEIEAIKIVKDEIFEVIAMLDEGKLRVATHERETDTWTTHAWIKSAILHYFRLSEMKRMEVGPFVYCDKIPLKKNYAMLNVRVVPPATARYGSFMEAGVVLMPSYVNIGAYVGAHTMVDTWATVGSCGQIGADVHLSGGVGIGGVLEPVSATPVIVEDGAFIGSRSIIVEGVRIGREAVLGANVTLTSSTPIIDTRTKSMKETKGYIPPRCVVLPGVKEKQVTHGKIFTPCVYIIGERKESTDRKTSLNDVLREFALSV
jgi:2,3,4,5-tetrahydropyridine-2-carboxylate N-succinyltransferase